MKQCACVCLCVSVCGNMCVCASKLLVLCLLVFSTATTDCVFQLLHPKKKSCKHLAGLPFLFIIFVRFPWNSASSLFSPSLFLVKFHLLSGLQSLLLVAVLKYLFVGRWWVVAVGWRWRIGAHHHMGGARLCCVGWVCHGDPWVTPRHPIDPKALHTSWLLGNWERKRGKVVNIHHQFTCLRICMVCGSMVIHCHILYIISITLS